ITRGVRGTAMPPWHELPDQDRLAVIQYIKYVLAVDRSDPKKPVVYFIEEPPKPPIYIGQPPPPSEALLAQGAKVWKAAKCWECHGETGKGDGEKAAGLTDDFGFPIPPANLTTGQFKSGPTAQDIFRTMSTGLTGTPMPSYSDTLKEEDRWALSYYVLALSAFTDPLTGEKMKIAPADRAALNDPKLTAHESHYAYKGSGENVRATRYAGEAWAEKHGIQIVAPAGASAK
ncbi:MAG: c-type cytochrome, partial [Pseudomonadota bacterium]|nr:c-type cytochrome [Pseudomonadota bacterium]